MNSSGAWIYLLSGDDVFSVEEAAKTLKTRMRALPAGEHNLTEIEASSANVNNLRMAADAMPFLADRRLVVVNDLISRLQGKSGGARKRGRAKAAASEPADEMEELLRYLPTVPMTTSIAFVERSKVDVSAVSAAIPTGRVLANNYPRPEPWKVNEWVSRRARLLEVDLDEAAARELALLGGDDLRRINSEIQKLGSYAGDRTVTREDVRELVVGRDVSMWALLDALTERRRDKALNSLRQLYGQGESPEALLARDVVPLYRRLLLAKEISLLDRRVRSSIDPNAYGLNPRTLPKQMENAAAFELSELQHALELLLDLDRQIKTGETDAETALETLIVQLCSRLGSGVS